MLITEQFIKYIIAGVIVAIFNLSFLYLLTELFNFWYILSITISFPLVFLLSFLLQKFWTFQNKSVSVIKKQAFQHLLMAVFNIIFNLCGVYILVEFFSVWYMLAQFIILVILSIISFVLYKFIVFK